MRCRVSTGVTISVEARSLDHEKPRWPGLFYRDHPSEKLLAKHGELGKITMVKDSE